MADFRVDTNAFNKAMASYELQATKLSTIKKNISANLQILRQSGWNSKAGEACMQRFDNQWAKEIDKYISLLNFLENQALKSSRADFENLINEADKL